MGVPSVHYYKNGRSAVANDVIGSQHYFGKNASGTKTEFAIIEGNVRTATAGAEAGGLDLSVAIAGVMTKFIRMSGNTGLVDMVRNVNMNGNTLQTTAGNLTLSATGSAGTGTLTLAPKALGNLILQNIPTSSAGLPSGAVWSNLGVLNIVP
jgi:hypothetical protein